MISWMERLGGAGSLVVASLCLSSGSTMGSEWVGCLLPAGGLLGFLDVLGCRSCIRVWGAVGVMAWTIDRIASTPGGGVMGGLPAWKVGGRLKGCFVGWHIGWRIGGSPCRSLVGRLGGGICGVQLLATTVSTSSSSEKIRPWARGLRVMRLKTIGRGWGGHPWWAQPLFIMIK